MVIEGKIRIPLKDKEIKIYRPKGFFAKLENTLTGGALERVEEKENLTVISFSNEIKRILKQNNIHDIIKLLVDKQIVYEDEKALHHNLDLALDNLNKLDKQDNIHEVFMVLLHEDENLHYVITIDLIRYHPPDKSPLVVFIKGIPKNLLKKEQENEANFKQRLEKEIFAGQNQFDQFHKQMRESMKSFVDNIEKTFQEKLNIENSSSAIRTLHVKNEKIEQGTNYFYSLKPSATMFIALWWDMLMDYKYFPDTLTSVINENGQHLGKVSNYDGFNPLPLDPPETNFWLEPNYTEKESWLDSWLNFTTFFGSDDDDDDDENSKSSCSSCRSCGL